jgi:hypothetical protein
MPLLAMVDSCHKFIQVRTVANPNDEKSILQSNIVLYSLNRERDRNKIVRQESYSSRRVNFKK